MLLLFEIYITQYHVGILWAIQLLIIYII